MPMLTHSRNFILNEFLNIEIGDQHLNKRLLQVAETINHNPAFSIPSMTNSEMAQLKGVYRFFQNPKVSEEKVLQSHYINTVERMDAHKEKILLLNESCFVSPAKAKEINRRKDPTGWLLWTTEKLPNASPSDFVVEGYTHRWKIEKVNKRAKTGVRVEERQFTDLDHFTPFLAMTLVVAWRMLSLRTVIEVSPDSNFKGAFEEDEISYLKAEGHKKRLEMKVVKDALYLTSRLGGFTGNYKRPRWQTLCQWWIKFYKRVEGFRLPKEVYSL